MEFRKKKHFRHGYVPWFPETVEGDDHFINYVHHGLHRETGEDVPFPDSSWSYTRNKSPFQVKERSDHEIHFKVLDFLYRNPGFDSSGINVMVHNGVVHVSGVVDSEKEKREMESVIRNINEVWDVENKLEVKGDI